MIVCTYMLIGLLVGTVISSPIDPGSARIAPETSGHVSTNSKVLANYLLPRDISPIMYDIQLTPYLDDAPTTPQKFTFDGSVTITVVVAHATRMIRMHAYDISVTKNDVMVMSMDETEINIDTLDLLPSADDRQFLTFNLDETLELGEKYQIIINYRGKLNDQLDGFYRSSYVENNVTKWLAVTQFESTGARRAFPCWDEPYFKAKFNLSIAHAPDYHVLANMPMIEDTPYDSAGMKGWMLASFETSETMPTYLVAFVVSQFKNVTNPKDSTYKDWARPGLETYATFSNGLALNFIKHMEMYTEHKYSLPKMDQIAIPDFAAGAMENWGLVTYRETALLYSDKVSSTSSKWGTASVVAHELAHQWFGNIVSPKWWSHIWLNEGFATYFSYYIVSQEFPEWKQMESIPQVEMHTVFRTDAVETSHPVLVNADTPATVNAVFDDIAYNKGACLIRMMIFMLGDEVFKTGINSYLTDKEFSNADKDDLWNNLQTAIPLNGLPDSLATIMDTWVVQAGYPVITVTRDYTEGKTVFNQTRFILLPSDTVRTEKWYVPITITSGQAPNFADTKVKVWLKEDSMETTLGAGANEWLLVNVQQAGYYRVNYDTKNWGLLTDAIGKKVDAIHFVNRAQMMDDALALARAKHLNYEVALDTTGYLAGEREYTPWAAALSGMAYLKDRLVYDSEGRKYFELYMLDRLEPVYTWLGGFTINTTDSDVVRRTRSMIVSWACTLNHDLCNEEAAALFAEWEKQTDPDTNNTIAPDLKSVVYCSGMREGGQAQYDFLFARYAKSANKPGEQSLILTALGCSSDTTLLKKYLDESIAAPSKIRTQDARSVLSSVQNNYIGVDVALDFLLENYDRCSQVYGGLGAMGRVFSSLSAKLNTEQHRAKLVDFKANNELGSVEQDVEGAIKTVDEILDWHEAHKSTIISYLRRKTNSAGLAIASPILALLALAAAVANL